MKRSDLGSLAEDVDTLFSKLGALGDYTLKAPLYARAGVLLDIGFARKNSDPRTAPSALKSPSGLATGCKRTQSALPHVVRALRG